MEEESEAQVNMYQLRLEGNGISINRQVPEEVALQIVSLTMGGAPKRSTGFWSTGSSPMGPGQGSRVSVREFMNQAGAKRNPEKIVAIGAYLMQELGREVFTRKEVKEQFVNAREPMPGNYTRDFDWAVSNGWLASAHGSSTDYYVTNSGFEAISNQFSEEIRKTTKLKVPRRRLIKRSLTGQTK